MALDNLNDYDEIKNKINANKTYKDLKNQYDSVTRRAGNSFEQKKSNVTGQLKSVINQKDAFQRQLKSQFEELLNISSITGGKGGNTVAYLKKTLLKTVNKIRPEIDAILQNEIITVLGCDQQQSYEANGQAIYIKVKSVDLSGKLTLDPATPVGKTFYEKNPIQIQSKPFSMNRELYERIQSSNPYSVDNGQLYLGASGQPLFDIQYLDVHPVTGVPGGWFKVILQNRINNGNKVVEFVRDYYKTIRIFEFVGMISNIMDAISGAISIEGDFGITENQDATTFSLYIQRILGLCFDNAKEIDVSGISKLAELDNINDSFFDLTDIDLRHIDNKVANIQSGVVEFEDCDNVKLPVNSTEIVQALNDMLFIEDIKDLEAAGDSVTNVLAGNPLWGGFQFNASLKASIELDFVKLICQGLIKSILSPKVLLPLMIMIKAISTSIVDIVTDGIDTFKEFFKKFKKLVISLISKIGALFVRELFEIIKKDLFNLLQSVVIDVAKEQGSIYIIIILKLTQLLIVVAQFISDWRRCKSVIDELLKLLTIATSGFNLPSPLLLLSKFLSGYSATRAFIGTIEEMQKIGLPTDSLPDGSPNLDLLSKFGQMKAQAKEAAENSKVEAVALPGYSFPNGTTGGVRVFGKNV